MKKISKSNMVILEKLMADFNDYSELVSLNYSHKTEESTLQWNRGSLNKVNDYLDSFSKLVGVELVYTFGAHPFLEEELEYRTVHLVGEDTTYHRTTKCDMKIR